MNSSVIIPKSHRNEWSSKRNFEELIEAEGMYMPFSWAVKDYGIDGHVEIAKPNKLNDNWTPEGKYFLVQLKSIVKIKIVGNEVAFALPVKKIIQWYRSNLPVLFALNDLNTGSFFLKWIDEKTVSLLNKEKPNWVNQQTVTVYIPRMEASTFLRTVREYVLSWNGNAKILPGTYFECKGRIESLLQDFDKLTGPFSFESCNKNILNLNKQLQSSIYSIAITGPSRVGKSSLINALLRRKGVSPTGIFQTTSVPIQILPDKKESITIHFENGELKKENYSSELIAEYASQEHNQDNVKKIIKLEVRITNKQLEQGVSFFDVPGLDDPSEEIFNNTWGIVSTSNALLYLIDASPFENGGYIFRREFKDNILEFGQSLDKVFLVFNKCNALSRNKLIQLKEQVERDLIKFDLMDKIGGKVFYLSAEESLGVRIGSLQGHDSVGQLENNLWEYLLSSNKTGLNNLSSTLIDISDSMMNFNSLLEVRLMQSEKGKELSLLLKEVRSRIPKFHKLLNTKKCNFYALVQNHLSAKKHKLLKKLDLYLRGIKLDDSLPSKSDIKSRIYDDANSVINATNALYGQYAQSLNEEASNWLRSNLKEVRDVIGFNQAQKMVDFSELDKFIKPNIDVTTPFSIGLFTGILASVLVPASAVVIGLTSFFASLVLSAEDRRDNRINKIIKNAEKIYDKIFNNMNVQYQDLIDEYTQSISGNVEERIELYFKDISIQIDNLGELISKEDRVKYENAMVEKNELLKEVNSCRNDLELLIIR